MRQIMSVRFCMLEKVYHETEIGRELIKDEQLERYKARNVGLDGELPDAFGLTAYVDLVIWSEPCLLIVQWPQ